MCSAVWVNMSQGSDKAVVSCVPLACFSMSGGVVRVLFVALDLFRVLLGLLFVIHVCLALFKQVYVCQLLRVIIVLLGRIPLHGVRLHVFPVWQALIRAA